MEEVGHNISELFTVGSEHHAEEGSHPMLEQTAMSYSKGNVHAIVWAFLFQILVSRTWFIEYVKLAFEKANGTPLEITEFPFVPEDRSTWDLTIRAWEKVHYVLLGLFGPYFVIGLFNLSDVLSGLGAFYIEHVISNLYIPAYVYIGW